MIDFFKVYLLFWIFSVIGWIMEEIVCSIYDKKIVNRGFLLGPYCPIYGFGGLVLLVLMPYKDDPLTCFILALVLCSVIEYVTSYVMEKLFKVRFWDYSNDSFNINGRVCLRNAIAFGLLGLLCVSYVIPYCFHFLNQLSPWTLYIVSVVIFIVTFIDMTVSCNIMNNLKKTITTNLDKFKNRDATNEIKDLVKKNLLDNQIFDKRIVKAFKNIEMQINDLFGKFDVLRKKVYDIKITYFTSLGLIIGIIIGYITDNYILLLTLGIITGFLADIIIYRIRRRKNEK